jgi:hypothetical protein
MRQSKYHRDIPDDAVVHMDFEGAVKMEYDLITMNSEDKLIGHFTNGSWFGHEYMNELEHLDIDEKLKLVAELIERKAHELEGYSELYAGLIIQRNLPGAKIVRKNKGSTNDT